MIRKVIGIAVTFALLSAAPALAADWTQAGRTASRSGFNGAEGVIGAGNVANLTPQWTYAAAGTVGNPIVAGGVVYFTTENGDLVAVDEASGGPLWSKAIATGAARIAVDKRRGIVVASWDGDLQAFHTATGDPAWSVPGAGTVGGSPTDPAIFKGKVLSATTNGSIIAVDVAGGGTLWETATITGNDAVTGPAVAKGQVLFVSGDGALARLEALALPTGAPLWDRTSPTGVSAGPVIAADVVYTASSTQGNIVARSVLDGALVWSKRLAGIVGIAFAQGTIYASRSISAGAQSGGVIAVDSVTGLPSWTSSTGGLSVTTAPAVANGLVYVGVSDERTTPVSDGRLLVLSTTPGTEFKTSPGVDQYWRSAPAVVNGRVIVGHANGLFALAP